MKSSYLSHSILLILILILNSVTLRDDIFCQGHYSIQVNGGIIFPMSSSRGLTGAIQFNNAVSPVFSIYLYAGYASWDKFYVRYIEEFSNRNHSGIFETYSADDHVLIPVFLGGRLNINTNAFFTAYVNFEVGYSHLRYNSYRNIKIRDPVTEEILSYEAEISSKREINENLLGIGIGAGISHPMTNNLNLNIAFRLNSYFNSDYYGFLSNKSIYGTFLTGFDFIL